MPYRFKSTDLTLRNFSFAAFRVYKQLAQRARPPHAADDKTIVLILGIQRSGTSLMYWVFERDMNVRVYREASELSSLDTVERIRLNPLPSVWAELRRQRAAMMVLKPLVESQRAHELMAAFPGARVLWAYRHYQDVAASNLKAFGMENGKSDLQPLLAGDPANWRSQNSSEVTRETIRRHYAPDMNPFDAAALFWWARMQLYFEQGLDRNPNVLLSRYEDLVTDPARTMRHTYAFLGRPYPGDHIVRDVNAQSVGKGRVSKLSPTIDALCADMLARLDRLNYAAAARLDAAGDPSAPRAAGETIYAGKPAK
jgi:hypothetical protein